MSATPQPPNPAPLAARAGSAESSGCAWTDLRAYLAACEKDDPDYRTPEERVLLGEMFQRYESLRKAGWQDIIYCPKDGTSFLSISAGSTGVHRCHYDGEWPKGWWWVSEAGDMWPAHPILWKPMPPSPNSRINDSQSQYPVSDAETKAGQSQ